MTLDQTSQIHALVKRSLEISELAKALTLAQAKIEHASKDSLNPHFRSKYADLASVWEVCRKPLTDNGLSVVQSPTARGQEVTVTTILLHTSGQFIESDLTVTAVQNTPQAIGSAITYARRYSLQSIVGIAPDDDDGNAASEKKTNANQNYTRPQKQETNVGTNPATSAAAEPAFQMFDPNNPAHINRIRTFIAPTVEPSQAEFWLTKVISEMLGKLLKHDEVQSAMERVELKHLNK